ncbi:CIC11C00000002114 [Sungouiella intermedia]|uniref:CIC11C00000002114 n=1 Tax=Sungouiella intermedia TaxID=45354 RepID=A0A1L0BKX1_9ASCO|nr:CIC11C00000002114 [[Candida] intermedia]
MASIDKENVTTTPLKMTSSPSVEYSPSNPKRALKPISPSKYNTNSVGKLNFLQNDNLDDHFECIHGSHEEIKLLLALIEVQTKQTNDDLEQLFDRLKSNNQNLNKLLESIAAYSEEVTTEGNATKSDVSKILERLNELSTPKLEQLFFKLLQESQEQSVKQIKTLISDSQGDPEDANIEVLLKLNNVERALNKVSEGSAKDIEKYMGTMNAETVNELTKVSDLLRHSSDSQKSTIDILTKKLEALDTHNSNSEIIRLQELVENQNATIRSLQVDVLAQLQTNEYKDLQFKHAQLQEKYESLCKYYESKYLDLVTLERKFTDLTNTVDHLESKVSKIDTLKYDRLQQMHVDKLSQLGKTQHSSIRKRIISMPTKATDLLPDIYEQINSDQEF